MSKASIRREDVEERRDRVEELTRQGLGAAQIAHILGITDRTVIRCRVARGCIQDRRPVLTAEELRTAEQMLNDGCPYTEVAASIGRSAETLRRRFPGKGLTPHETGMYNWARRRLELL